MTSERTGPILHVMTISALTCGFLGEALAGQDGCGCRPFSLFYERQGVRGITSVRQRGRREDRYAAQTPRDLTRFKLASCQPPLNSLDSSEALATLQDSAAK